MHLGKRRKEMGDRAEDLTAKLEHGGFFRAVVLSR